MNNELDFEKGLERLQTIVSELEEGKVSLDDSLSLYEEGVTLAVKLQNKLKTVEEKTLKIFNEKENEN